MTILGTQRASSDDVAARRQSLLIPLHFEAIGPAIPRGFGKGDIRNIRQRCSIVKRRRWIFWPSPFPRPGPMRATCHARHAAAQSSGSSEVAEASVRLAEDSSELAEADSLLAEDCSELSSANSAHSSACAAHGRAPARGDRRATVKGWGERCLKGGIYRTRRSGAIYRGLLGKSRRDRVEERGDGGALGAVQRELRHGRRRGGPERHRDAADEHAEDGGVVEDRGSGKIGSEDRTRRGLCGTPRSFVRFGTKTSGVIPLPPATFVLPPANGRCPNRRGGNTLRG